MPNPLLNRAEAQRAVYADPSLPRSASEALPCCHHAAPCCMAGPKSLNASSPRHVQHFQHALQVFKFWHCRSSRACLVSFQCLRVI